MAGGSPSAPLWTPNGVASLPNSQGNIKDTQAAAAGATPPSPWPQSSSTDTDSSLLSYQHSMQSARLTAAMASRGPSACSSPYHFPWAFTQRPQLQTTRASHTPSPIPITGRLQGPPTAPAFYGHHLTMSPDPSVIPDWLSAGAQPSMIGTPWRTHESGTTHQDRESSAGTQSGDFSLATPGSSSSGPLDIGPFEMDPVIPTDPSSVAGGRAPVSTQERSGDCLPWGHTGGAEQTYSQDNFLASLDAQSLATPASIPNQIASSTSVPSENGSVYHPSPAASPQQDPDMANRLRQAHLASTQFQLALNGTHLPAPQDPLSVLTTNPAHLPNISKRRSSEDVVPFIDGSRVAPVVRPGRARRSLQQHSSQISGVQYRPSYSPYQRPASSSPLHMRSHVRQMSGSSAHTLSPHDSGIFLSPRPRPPSVSSSVGSHSRENSLGGFPPSSDAQGYDMPGVFFPFPSVHPGADKAHGEDSANSLQLMIQLPQPLPVPQFGHSTIAYPVGAPAVPAAVPAPAAAAAPAPNWYPKPTPQTKEGKLQIDHTMINASFRDIKDPLSAQRRVVLERILQSIWFQSHELEPKVSGPYDELTGGLGVGGRSVYTCFLKFMTPQEGNGHGSATGSGGKWVCLFGDEDHPCPKARWEEGFNKPERAIEHIRSHLGHRPFWCNNECGSNPACTWKFFANSHRYDHWKKPHKRSHCDVWPKTSFGTWRRMPARRTRRSQATPVARPTDECTV